MALPSIREPQTIGGIPQPQHPVGQSTIPGALRNDPGGGGALPQGWHPPMAPPSSSPAPPASTGSRGATPASANAGGNGGAGTPDQMLSNTDPENVINTAEGSAKRAKNVGGNAEAKAQAQQINEAMAAQGMDPEQSYTELKDRYMKELDAKHESGQIDKKQYTKLKDRWKNIFQIVPKEDFGLFLMDFGMRLAAHSAETSFGGAFGQAGLGALAGAQERQRYEQQGALNRDQMAHERAMDMVGLGQRQQQIDTLSQKRVGDPIDTNVGLIQRDPQTGEWTPVQVAGHEGPISKSYAADRPYGGEKVWLDEQLESIYPNLSRRERLDIILGGGTPEQRESEWRERFYEMAHGKDAILNRDESGKRYSEYTPKEREEWIQRALQEQDEARQTYYRGRAGGGALNGGGAAGPSGGGRQIGPPPGLSAEERARWYRDNQ